ncbi:GNAT family N-acetyltransferase [Rhodococcus rhodnii]|uniref:N-acetylglutamate synthase, CG3035 family n=1 Tax=Rhodococcus rhodnii TaxID=38312 RepID=UPI001EE6A14C|nr:GNAT family N-acetyltransferase [Rhodococcus rhodnii]
MTSPIRSATTTDPVVPELPALGTRVVVRYSLPAGYSHPVTDVIGTLEGTDPVAVRSADGRVVQIGRDTVVAVRALGPRPIRTSEIRALEVAAAQAWPGLESTWVDGWLARYGSGITGRANSATPLGMPGELAPLTGDTLARLDAWYAERGLPLRLLVPDRLSPGAPGWQPEEEPVVVLAADLDLVPLPTSHTTTVLPEPDASWLSLFDRRGADDDLRALLTATLGRGPRIGELAFVRIGDGPSPLAIARAAVTTAPDGRVWVGLQSVAVAPEHRRRGVGTLVCGEALRWGRERGATHAYLQVTEGNAAARAMYSAMGFTEHHRYRYHRRVR